MVILIGMKQTILITGAARGLGRDAALTLAKRGHKVIATTHTEAQVETLRRETLQHGVNLQIEKLDITSSEDVERLAQHDIDVLINNAATGESGPISEVPLDRFERVLNNNLVGTLRLTQRIVKNFIAKKQGRIIFLSSIVGRLAIPYLGPYSLSKFGIEAMGDLFRMELKPFKVKVSIIEPGPIYTGFNEQVAETKYHWLKADSPFAKDLEKMKKHDVALTKSSYSSSSVIEAIVQAVESPRPRARYMRPKKYAFLIPLANHLPTPLHDWVVRRSTGI